MSSLRKVRNVWLGVVVLVNGLFIAWSVYAERPKENPFLAPNPTKASWLARGENLTFYWVLAEIALVAVGLGVWATRRMRPLSNEHKVAVVAGIILAGVLLYRWWPRRPGLFVDL